MAAATLTPSAPLIQGVPSPDVVVDPNAFYAATRRLRYPMKSLSNFAGIGSTDSVQLIQSGIVAALEVRVAGTIVIGGTIGTTTASYEWPFNLVQAFRLSANGQSQLVNATGLKIRALEFASNTDLTDRGVSRSFNSATVTQGTLSLSCDDWGTSGGNVLAPNTNAGAVGTYTVDITFVVPVAADQVSLIGAVYAQSSATALTLDVQWATQSQIFSAVGGAATLTYNLQWSCTGVVYSIPNVGGKYVVPDLSQFHQVSEFRTGGLAQGVNEVQLPGVGVGRKLLRVVFNVYSNSAPLAINDTNYSTVGWRYGGSDTPEQFSSGGPLRALNERQTGVDFGRNWGIGMWDFASQFALRDVVDEGSTANLRVLYGLVSSPTSGASQTLHETLFAAAVGA